MKSRLFLGLIILLLTVCTDEEPLHERPYPAIETLEVSSITSEGALLNGNFLRLNGEVIDYGFLWSSDEILSLNNAERRSMGPRKEAGTFSALIETTLKEGQLYRVRAYAQTVEYTVYGNIVEFVSLGSKAPVIFSFTPSSAAINDTISIEGKHFSVLGQSNIVKFNTAISTIISATDTLVKVKVPPSLHELNSSIHFSIAGNTATASGTFTLLPPKLIGINKTSFGYCDTLQLSTQNILTNDGNLQILFNNAVATPIKVENNQLTVIPPFVQNPQSLAVSLKWINNTSTLPESTSLLLPQFISQTHPEHTFADTVILNFQKLPRCNLRILNSYNNQEVTILENTGTQIKIILPSLLGNDVTLRFLYQGNLILTATVNRKIEISSVTPALTSFNDLITIKGKGFKSGQPVILTFLSSSSYINVNPIEIKEQEIIAAIPPDLQRGIDGYVNIQIQVGNMLGYLENAVQLKSPVIHSVEFQNNRLTLIGEHFSPVPDNNHIKLLFNERTSDSPIEASSEKLVFELRDYVMQPLDPYLSTSISTSFELNSGGAVVAGEDLLNYEYKGLWTQKSNFPGLGRTGAVTFTIGNKGYLGLGKTLGTNTYLSDFWEYEPNSDTWTSLPNFPGGPRNLATGWSIQDRGFVAFGEDAEQIQQKDIWRFDPLTKTWSQLTDFPGSARMGVHFANYNNQYTMLFSGQGNDVNKQVWKFIPETESWIQLNNTPHVPFAVTYGYNQIRIYTTPSTSSTASKRAYWYGAISDIWYAGIEFNLPSPYFVAFTYQSSFLLSSTSGFNPQRQLQRLLFTPEQWESIPYRGPIENNAPLVLHFSGKFFVISTKTVFEMDETLYP